VKNAEYWNQKLDRTLERDKNNGIVLEQLGWQVLIEWECETKKKCLHLLVQKLNSTLNDIYVENM
jgi:DNA mismatch endonuclease (patch repair protein)